MNSFVDLRQRMPRNLTHVHALVDHRGVVASPGAVLTQENSIIAVGTPQEIGIPENASLTQIDGILTPSFVNTHTHLDLSGAGPVPARDSFSDWVVEVVSPIRKNKMAVSSAFALGEKLVRAGGSVIVGDIAGSKEAALMGQQSSLNVTSFYELIDSTNSIANVLERIRSLSIELDLSPHAPYSCSPEVFKAAFASGRKVSTHLCETLEEIEYAYSKGGAIAELENRLGVSSDKKKTWGTHPLEMVLQLAGGCKFIAAHLNYLEDEHISMLASSKCSLSYCPRASAYFGHKNHRWRELLNMGVNVSIGTDSLLCLDTPDRISVIDELRFLFAEGNIDNQQLLKMGTINGANALGVNPGLVSLTEGETAGLLIFERAGDDPLVDLLASKKMPVWL